jgi:hypothetical protein
VAMLPEAGGVRSKEDVIALAVSLARPVVRGMLPIDHAEAAIAAAIGRAWRIGILPYDTDPEGLIGIANHILRLNIELQENKRDAVISEIMRKVRPLIDKRLPLGRVRAEAHDVNADGGSLLTEAEVEEAIVHMLYQARARAQARSGVMPPSKPPWRPRRYHV